MTITLPCDYCQSIGSQISSINDTFSDAVDVVNDMTSFLNDSTVLTDAQNAIENLTKSFDETVDELLNQVNGYRSNASKIIDAMDEYDEQRESAGFIFFVL